MFPELVYLIDSKFKRGKDDYSENRHARSIAQIG